MIEKQVYQLIEAIRSLRVDQWQEQMCDFCNKLKIHCEILRPGLSLVKINSEEYFISLDDEGFSYYSISDGLVECDRRLSLTRLLTFIKEKIKDGKHN